MINQTISHYRIIGKLGSGGMGVVYEAEDLTLGRKVALKFLPPQLSSDKNALDRFLFEARTASALNHPNICTIYAVEHAAGDDTQSFIAMELLEGQSLDQKLYTGALSTDRLLDIAIQLADALEAAHAKGIIHRDIKPANIFISPRGQVKVLDFGLAKLTRREIEMETIGPTQDSPRPAHLTSPNATVGTIAYMSPEQARGEELDTRSDLFSLGTVLYQMATGKLPFAGATSAVVFHAILELDPVPPLQLNTTLPSKLQEIVEKLLEKDRDLRYQSAADLRGDLKRLKRDVESGKKGAAATGAASISGPAVPVAATLSSPSGTQSSGVGSSQSSAVIAAVRPGRLKVASTVAIILLVVAAAGYGLYSFLNRTPPAPFQNFTVSKVTEGGKSVEATISPDGKYILNMVRENGKASLWLHNVPTSSDTQVQPAADVYYNGLRFSPDGNYFYFVRSDPGNSELKFLYRAPLLGGTPQKLASDVDSNVTFSPDGQQFAFMRDDNPERGKYQLIVRPVDSDVEKVLAGGPMSQNLYGPAWSPDGKTIVCNTIQSGNGFVGMVTVDIATGKKTPFFSSNQRIFEFPAWLPDGSGVLGNYREQSTNFTRSQIGIVSYPKGIFAPVTRDTNNYYAVSVAASGRILATILSEDRWNIFVMPAADRSAQARQITPADGGTNFTWTHDGKLIDDQENRLNLIDLVTGAKSVMAMQGQASGAPWTCASGRYLLYDIFDSGNGNQNVGRMDTSTSDTKQLTNERVASAPVCSSDVQWVYYISQADEQRLARVSIDGGSSQIISELPMSGTFDISPDGKLGAFPTLEHSAGHKEMLALVATGGAKAEKLIEFERPRFGLLRFSPDGKAVVYPARENGVDNLWLQPLDGSKGHALTSFTAEHIYDFHWSFDGKQLALVRGHDDADVVLIRDAQP